MTQSKEFNNCGLNEENQILKLEILNIKRRLNNSQTISKIGSWEWNMKNNKISWSESMFSILGLSSSDQIPTYKLALNYIHEDDKSEYEKKLNYVLENKTECYIENRIRKENKETITVISKIKCVYSDENKIIGMAGTVKDISLIKKIVQDKQVRDEIVQKFSEETTSTINTVIGYINLLKVKINENSGNNKQVYLDEIEKSLQELKHYTCKILESIKQKH